MLKFEGIGNSIAQLNKYSERYNIEKEIYSIIH
jgi:hypothetical protein